VHVLSFFSTKFRGRGKIGSYSDSRFEACRALSSWWKWCRFVQLNRILVLRLICFFPSHGRFASCTSKQGGLTFLRTVEDAKTGVGFVHIGNLLPFFFLVSYKGIATVVQRARVQNHACYA